MGGLPKANIFKKAILLSSPSLSASCKETALSLKDRLDAAFQ